MAEKDGKKLAKFERQLYGNFDEILNCLHNTIMRNSTTVSYEDGSDFSTNSCRCAIRSYERYTYLGKGRVSLTFTLLESDGKIFVSAISSGGSQAMFFKINTIGERNFLDTISGVIESYSYNRREY